jgi:heptosyltransferase-1
MRILIVRLSSLGDIVTSMVSLQFIKAKYPSSSIEWLVDARFEEILKDNPDLDKVHPIFLKKYRKNPFMMVYEVIRILRKIGKFDLIIDMQGLIKSAILSRLIGQNVVGFDWKSAKEGLSSVFYEQKAHISFSEHILKRNQALLQKSLGIELTYSEMMQKKSYLPYRKPFIDLDRYFSKTKKNILVILGGSWPSKIYPKNLLKEVVSRIAENILILWSNEEERDRGKWIASQCPNATLLPQMSLNDVKALIHKSDLILGNDTGPTHMAWALNRPSVTILGCTSITRIPENEKNISVTSRICVNPSKINKKDTSINEIPPFEIVEAVLKLL